MDIIFPKKCLTCGAGGMYVCKDCTSKLSFVSQICPFCKNLSITGETHLSCIKQTPLDGLLIVWKFDGVAKKAIHSIKYRFAHDVSKEFSLILTKSISERFLKFFGPNWTLVPIPLQRKRQNWRGFNQSELLGLNVAKTLVCEFDNHVLERKLETVPQVELSKRERLRSIRGIFAVNPAASSRIKGQKIIVFDDVWTTGSTISEAAMIFKKLGAKEVWGMAVAR